MDQATTQPGPWELVVMHAECVLVRRFWPSNGWQNPGRTEVMSRPDGEPRKFQSEAAARAAIVKATL